MSQVETEKLTRMVMCAALSRAICTVAELGIADQIEPGDPQSHFDYAYGIDGQHSRR